MAALANRAHGVVTWPELLAAGLTRRQIERRVESGALLPQHPGVYRVGHAAPNREATYMAAVRACGAGAVLSGMAAAHLHGLVKGTPPPPEVTAPRAVRIGGLMTRCRALGEADTTHVLRIPVTTIARTLVDLAAVRAPAALARACHEATAVKRVPVEEIDAALSRRPNTRGARSFAASSTATSG